MDEEELEIFLKFLRKKNENNKKITYLEKIMDGKGLKVLH